MNEEEAIVSVEIMLTGADIAGPMNEMRLWLDHERIEPLRFVCTEQNDEAVVVVEFSVADEALAFAERFAGCMLSG